MMRRIFILILVALMFPLVGVAIKKFRDGSCDLAMWSQSDASSNLTEDTAVSAGTFRGVDMPDADSTEDVDRLGRWGDGATDHIEFCYTGPSGNDYSVEVVLSIESNTISSTYFYEIGRKVGTGLGDDGEGTRIYLDALVVGDRKHATIKEVVTGLASGDCIGPIVKGTASNMTVQGWYMQAEQITGCGGN